MEEYWLENGPPAHISLAAHLGLIEKSGNGTSMRGTQSLRADSDENRKALEELAASFEGSGGLIGG